MDQYVSPRMRWLALYAALLQLVTRRHVYLSTSCLAERHARCDQMVGTTGEKTPGRSKFSGAACICPHHKRT